jgi:hypothetical protein
MILSDPILLAYLDESLPSDAMAKIEAELRNNVPLRQRLVELIARRDNGVHTVGDIWRRHRLSCPTREELGSYLLQAMMDEQAEYVRFHIETVGCRYCQANLEDLSASQQAPAVAARRKRYFQSSVGRVRNYPE